MSNKHKHNNQIKQSQKEMRIKRSNNQPIFIVVSTSLDGGEGGGGMIPTGSLGPPPPIFLFLEAPERLFF